MFIEVFLKVLISGFISGSHFRLHSYNLILGEEGRISTMGSTDSSANETSDTEIDERQKVNRRKTQKVEYKPDYETGKIFRHHYFDFVDIVNLTIFSDEKIDDKDKTRTAIS